MGLRVFAELNETGAYYSLAFKVVSDKMETRYDQADENSKGFNKGQPVLLYNPLKDQRINKSIS